jgi:hypothetical protein
LPVAEVYSGDVHADERPRRRFDRDSVRAEHGRTHPLDHRGLDRRRGGKFHQRLGELKRAQQHPVETRARSMRVVQCPRL